MRAVADHHHRPPRYPKLAHVLESMVERLSAETTMQVSQPPRTDAPAHATSHLTVLCSVGVGRWLAVCSQGVVPAVGPEQLQQLLGATAPLQVRQSSQRTASGKGVMPPTRQRLPDAG